MYVILQGICNNSFFATPLGKMGSREGKPHYLYLREKPELDDYELSQMLQLNEFTFSTQSSQLPFSFSSMKF